MNNPPGIKWDNKTGIYLELHKKMEINDLLYVFIDNLHDFADEGSLNGKDNYKDLGTIALYVAYSLCDQGKENEVLTEFGNLINSVTGEKVIDTNTDIKEEFIKFITGKKGPDKIGEIKKLFNKKRDTQ